MGGASRPGASRAGPQPVRRSVPRPQSFASQARPYAFLLVMPLVVGLALFARERTARIAQAMSLVDSLDRERARVQAARRRIGETAAANLDRGALERIIVDTAVELIDADGGRLSAAGPAGGPFVTRAHAGAQDSLGEVLTAVETAVRSQDPVKQQRLMSIILDDIERLSRLITDISDASRLDAEMSRAEMSPVKIKPFARSISEIESRLRSLGSTAQQTVGDQKRSLAAAGVIGGALTIVASYLHGRRRGRKRATVLEIRRS